MIDYTAQDLVKFQFEAIREIQVIKTGKVEMQTTMFSGSWYARRQKIQEIYESADPITAYKEWVLSKAEDEIVEIYGKDAYEPIERTVINVAKDHTERFTAWVECSLESGYEISLKS